MPTVVHNTHVSIAEAEIRELLDSIFQAHHDKTAAAIAAPYAPNAAIFDLSPPLAHPGVTLERMQPWLDSWETPIDLEFRNLRITVDGEHAYGHGFLRMLGTKKGADHPVDFWMRATYCFAHGRNGWSIVHEHTSVPFYMDESLRPAFDLQP
ncbi:MAG TPA: nuclear transport factor 2 family protein [Terracidiphilus sp.]|nr:nuclear transport factor 2 family protein [Terracidiphilus sp.]